MAQLAVQEPGTSGAAINYVAADGAGDTFPNDGRTRFHVKNGGGAAITATVDAKTACNFGFDHDAAVNVPAGAERVIGPFRTDRFGSTVSVAYSSVATVTVAAVR